MTFRLDLVNRAGLFRHYAAWHEDGNCADLSHVTMAHHIGLLVYSLEKLFRLRDESLDQFREFLAHTTCSDDEILFDSPGMFDVFSTFSSVLLSQRLCQNALIDIIGQKLRRSLPSSMSALVKALDKYQLPSSLANLINKYWETSGKDVKNYRDVDQHFGLVARHAFIRRNTKQPQLSIYLPDNPREKSHRKFLYTEKKDLFHFCDTSFSDIHDLINSVSRELGYSIPRAFDYNINFPSDLQECLMITFDPTQSTLV